jgi:hypothetical protein
MKKVCILLFLITYVYHNARFKKREVRFHMSTNRQCTYDVTLRRVLITQVAVEKQQVLNSIKCVSTALVIQRASRLRRTI